MSFGEREVPSGVDMDAVRMTAPGSCGGKDTTSGTGARPWRQRINAQPVASRPYDRLGRVTRRAGGGARWTRVLLLRGRQRLDGAVRRRAAALRPRDWPIAPAVPAPK